MAVFIDLRPQLKHIRLLYIFIGILVCTASFKGCHSGKQLNVRATYDTLMRNEWIIAAPVDTMTNNTTIELYSEYSEMKKRIIEDPIIFKASKIGAVIVTMWDKEAEDSMFDKYR